MLIGNILHGAPLYRLATWSLLGLSGLPCPAADRANRSTPSPPEVDDLYALDLKDLFQVEVTTASKFSERESEAPGIMSVVTREELRRFRSLTLREVLERLPELSRASAYFTDRSLVGARGDQTKIDGGHLLILINGRPTREILEGGIITDLLESFPVRILERIELIRGPGSVLYGSNAFSGVVNLITQKADGTGFAVTGMPGPGGAAWSSGQAAFERGALSIIGAAQFQAVPEWNTNYGYRDPLTGVTSFQRAVIREQGSGAYLGINYKGWSLMSAFTEWQSASFVRGIVGEPHWTRGFADIAYGFRVKPKWDTTVNFTYTRTTFEVAEYPFIRRNAHEIVLEWTNYLRPTDEDQITFGALYNHIQGRERFLGISPALTISDGSRSAGAIYGQLDHHLLPSLKLIGGFQANKIGNIALDAVPRVGVIWNPGSHIDVKLLYSQAFRAPSINETRLNHPGLEGNPDLRPEKVATVDIGIAYAGSHAEAGITYFHSHQTDRIIEDTSTPRWKYRNIGDATFQGIEFEGKYKIEKQWLMLGSLAYQANVDGSGSRNVTPMPNWLAKAGISYEGENGVSASLFDAYQGALDRRFAGTLNPNPTTYHLVNASVRYDLSKRLGLGGARGVALVAHADDLANQRVWLPAWGDNSGDTMPITGGRSIRFGIEVCLKKE